MILETGINGYIKVWGKERRETGRINRAGAQKSVGSRYKKLCGKTTWFQEKAFQNKDDNATPENLKQNTRKKNPQMVEGVMFVPYTPGGVLKKELQEIDRKMTLGKKSGKTKFVEKLGSTIGSILSNPYPWKDEHCGRINCPPCKTQTGKCKIRNMVYQITCTKCKAAGTQAHYVGETHRTFYDRASEQAQNLRNQSESSALFKHWKICHPEEEEAPIFDYKCLRSYKTSTERQVAEAVFIDSIPYDIILNSKAEYRHNSLVRHRIEFKGAILQDSIEQTEKDNTEVVPSKPPTDTEGPVYSFSNLSRSN